MLLPSRPFLCAFVLRSNHQLLILFCKIKNFQMGQDVLSKISSVCIQLGVMVLVTTDRVIWSQLRPITKGPRAALVQLVDGLGELWNFIYSVLVICSTRFNYDVQRNAVCSLNMRSKRTLGQIVKNDISLMHMQQHQHWTWLYSRTGRSNTGTPRGRFRIFRRGGTPWLYRIMVGVAT